MKTKQVIEASHRISKPYRVTNGKEFQLKDVDPGDTGELKSEDKPRANLTFAFFAIWKVFFSVDPWLRGLRLSTHFQ